MRIAFVRQNWRGRERERVWKVKGRERERVKCKEKMNRKALPIQTKFKKHLSLLSETKVKHLGNSPLNILPSTLHNTFSCIDYQLECTFFNRWYSNPQTLYQYHKISGQSYKCFVIVNYDFQHHAKRTFQPRHLVRYDSRLLEQVER